MAVTPNARILHQSSAFPCIFPATFLSFFLYSCGFGNYSGNPKEAIKDMLAKGFIGTRIFNELTDMGYKGSLSSVHRYLRSLKEEERNAKLATTRVETKPGQQMQYDWKEWMLPVAGKHISSRSGFI